MRCYGIPKLFRWLVDLYPIVLESVDNLHGKSISVDNFYLDMNGIIHTCTHSNDDKLILFDEREMFQRIFSYTDRLYKLVRPTTLMFLAVDGVAPRAKMNQQRARRFRAAKERDVLLSDYVAKHGTMPDFSSFDSNCITPGTDFMFRLGIAFRHWIKYKVENDPYYKNNCEIVFSGPDVPGEGEHKVMEMIRIIIENEEKLAKEQSRKQLKHCMYGLDADLIMLSLVTHEPQFVLLREKISKRKQNKDVMAYTPEDFELLEISLLRKMLNSHFKKMGDQMNLKASKLAKSLPQSLESLEVKTIDNYNKENLNSIDNNNENNNESQNNIFIENNLNIQQSSVFDMERVIDDFVFMCFFVGNDFLPCLPHLDIADGSLNLMMNVYKETLPNQLHGYLTNKSFIHLPRLELFLQEIARREPLYFQQRAVDEKDEVYASKNYKAHYYKVKFGIEPGDQKSIDKIVHSYLEGLAWVLEYYHAGCGSWTWYYPYLYAPLATDLIDIAQHKIIFEQGRPFTPLLQLLSVLPPQSANFLPPSYEEFMTNPNSPVVEYYPKDFSVDANGKKNSWECIVRIPFINETILVDTINTINHKKELTESERLRNIAGIEHRFKASEIAPVGSIKPLPSKGWGSAIEGKFKQKSSYNSYSNSDNNNQINNNNNNNNNNNGYKKVYTPTSSSNNNKIK
eukprot:gene8756-11830_t